MNKKSLVKISEVEEGMKLAEDVIDAKGICLITAGTELSKSAIKGLINRSVTQITIYLIEQLGDEEKVERVKNIKKELDHRFSKVIDMPLMSELKAIFMEHRTQGMIDD